MSGADAVVAGGLGFIGSAVTAKLCEQGKRVVVLNRGNRVVPPRLIPYLDQNLQVIRQDLTQICHFRTPLIYNLASPAAPQAHLRNPVGTIQDNVLVAMNLMNMARLNNARFIQASTGDIYGQVDSSPITELDYGSVDPLSSRSSYVESKRLVETLVASFRAQYGVESRIGRLFSTYGPGMALEGGRLITNLILASLRGQQITLTGEGRPIRTFLYVEDAADAITSLADSDLEDPVNIGSGHPLTLLEVAKMIVSLTDSESKILLEEDDGEVPFELVPNLSRISRTGWREKHTFQEGLRLTIDDIRKRTGL